MKLPFIIRKAFKSQIIKKHGKLFLEFIPKRNLWFYVWVFITAFKVCLDIDKIEEDG